MTAEIFNSYSIIANPYAGKGNGKLYAERVRKRLEDAGKTSRVWFTERRRHATSIAEDLSGDGIPFIVVGGDGTVNEVISGILESGNRAPLGVVPAGSGNDLIKSLNIDEDTDAAVETVLNGRTREVDAGECNERYFLNIMGVGFDGAVIAEMERKRSEKKRIYPSYKPSYNRALLHTIMHYKSPELILEVDDERIRRRFFLISIANGTTFGGDFVIAPMADMSDGKAVVVYVEHISKPKFFWHIRKVKKGQTLDLPEVRYIKGKKIRISSSKIINAQLDGEHYSGKQFDIRIIPGAVEIFAP